MHIDTFSGGVFDINSGASGSYNTNVNCSFNCIGGRRTVAVNSLSPPNVATAQLPSPSAEAQIVIPVTGGSFQFTYGTYTPGGADITTGGVGQVIEVQFTVFAPGAAATVLIQDVNGSQGVQKLPSGPGTVSWAFSEFPAIDPTKVIGIRLFVASSGGGDYHVTDIRVPDLAGTPSDSLELSLGSVSATTGDIGLYPSSPPIQILVDRNMAPFMEVEVELQDVMGIAAASPVQVPASLVATPDAGHEIFLATNLLAQPPDPCHVIQRLHFLAPGGGSGLSTTMVQHDWVSGSNDFTATAVSTTPLGTPGRYAQQIFFEVPLAQAGTIANVSVMPGSLSIDIEMSGIDETQPVLQAVTTGTFTPAAHLPSVAPTGLIALCSLFAIAGIGLLLRRRAPAGSAPKIN